MVITLYADVHPIFPSYIGPSSRGRSRHYVPTLSAGDRNHKFPGFVMSRIRWVVPSREVGSFKQGPSARGALYKLTNGISTWREGCKDASRSRHRTWVNCIKLSTKGVVGRVPVHEKQYTDILGRKRPCKSSLSDTLLRLTIAVVC